MLAVVIYLLHVRHNQHPSGVVAWLVGVAAVLWWGASPFCAGFCSGADESTNDRRRVRLRRAMAGYVRNARWRLTRWRRRFAGNFWAASMIVIVGFLGPAALVWTLVVLAVPALTAKDSTFEIYRAYGIDPNEIAVAAAAAVFVFSELFEELHERPRHAAQAIAVLLFEFFLLTAKTSG